ncbi:MAG: 2-amino-4-hydroxy-6-hydroxymethyldihydropteridine diphosphokinase, partial [Prevotella sp.]|nr:2-amino-4-hydroxy-6-hydroxymethyldihydropteridine diphosphokinase [Prevotella sp.]
MYLGLGSNLGDREANLLKAITMIGERIGNVVRQSTFMETEP